MKGYYYLIIIPAFLLGIIGCTTPEESSSESTISGANGESGTSPVTGITLNAKISGSVTTDVVSSTESISGNYSRSNSIGKHYATSTISCDYSAFEVHMIGGDGTAISKGAVSGGLFQASADSDHEVVLTFECGIRCFGKPGSTDLVCDAIADAVVEALESELNASVETSSLFVGLSIAKIAEGIVETLKLMSALDPTNSIIDNLTAAAAVGGDTGKALMKDIIMQSTVGTLFTSLATLAEEKKAENEALAQGLSLEEAKAAAAAAAWSMEKVVKMLVGIGMTVQVDFDGEMSIYSDMMSNLDGMTDSDFMTQLKAYVLALYEQLYGDNPETSDVTLVCQARKQSNTGPEEKITYPPYKVNNQLTCMHAASPSDTDVMGITTSNGATLATDIYLEAKIKGSVDEANRNDPTGTRENNYGGINEITVNYVDIFPEYEEMLEQGICSDYITMGSNGPEEIKPGFVECAKAAGMDKYFSGLVGIYKFMRNVNLRESKFSLDDIYTAMVDLDYVGLRMQANFWQIGVSDYWVSITGSDFDWSPWIPAYQLKDTGTTDSDGQSVFNAECAKNISGAVDLCDANGPLTGPILATADQLAALYDNYTPGYASTLQMFENIPSMTDIKNSIFKDAHHEPYNVAGPETFHVKGVYAGSGSNEWEGDTPILCKINTPNAAGDFAVGSSSITCELASGTTWGSDGKPANTSTYQSYYALQERGGGGGSGDNDRFYGLVNINNGTDYMVNGRQFRVRGLHPSYTPSDSNPVRDGKTLYPINKEFCDTWTDESDGSTQTHCWFERFDYVAVDFSTSWFKAGYYFPFLWDIPITSTWWNGTEYVEETWNMWIAVTNFDTLDNYDDDYAVCVKSAGVPTTNTNDESEITGAVTLTGNMINCFDNTETGNFYYLSPEWSTATSSTAIQYRLIRDDGTWMWSNNTPDWALKTKSDIETALSGKDIGPGDSEWMLGFNIANLGHDAKFDPYCDDQNGDGECNCNDDDGDGECTLADSVTEPTISDPPFWPGSPDADNVKTIIQGCGGKSGEILALCLNNTGLNFDNIYADWNRLFECQDSSKTLQWVDLNMTDGMPAHTAGQVANYGNGCGSGTTQDNKGVVRLKNLRKRRNAYNVERPNKMLKLISAATATTGTGVSIGKTDGTFVFQEALALALLRINFPTNALVKYYNGSAWEAIPGLRVYLEKTDIPGKPRGLSNGLLRAFLEGAGELEPATNISN